MPTSPERIRRRVNVRTPEVMERVQAEVANHYQSSIVEKVRARGGSLSIGNTTIRLAQQFGFCYGVERAIDLAYASRRVFPENRVFLIGEIIHNPEVNRQLEEMKIVSLPWRAMNEQYDELGEDDVVIVPAFGAPLSFMDKVESRGCHIVDTTCGDVMKVWKRVRGFAKDGITSIIHGKADHEETRATASRAAGDDGKGHYLIVLTLADIDYVCDYLEKGGDPAAFRERFRGGAMSEGFDPDHHLARIGVANQTTMLKSETEEIQRRVREAIVRRDGSDANFSVFDTICGATQERQDALFDLLKEPLDLLLVVGGYNSSNTTHLVEIGEKELPTFFIRSAECLVSVGEILHYDIHRKEEVGGRTHLLATGEDVLVGITAGASCPNNLIEDTILKIFELRGIPADAVRAA
ncbi:MAG: 4-hydroxy-3-methylbut-2-enyl diphosphate reductase [Verrucomicrobiales bacterium]|nr:4-hydroxy-3-methylbut-2-enyl diphosphate reductase [Verrucomicrobiales bacterium]